LVVAGGVAANERLSDSLAGVARTEGYELVVPPVKLCTDNGAMVAWAGLERLELGLADDLSVAARARWPLDRAREAIPGAKA
jgi:N6-L-threonylcarbamoyladenine synthase